MNLKFRIAVGVSASLLTLAAFLYAGTSLSEIERIALSALSGNALESVLDSLNATGICLAFLLLITHSLLLIGWLGRK